VTTAIRAAFRLALLLEAWSVLAALDARPIMAQAPLLTQPLDSGAVIRLRLRDGSREGAKLLTRFAPDSQSFSYCRWPALPCVRGGERHVVRPAREVLGVEIHRGSQWKLGGIVGALAGVPMGFELIALSEFMGEQSLSGPERFRAIAGSVVGWALFGAMIGEFFQRWGPAP
jgi:hypothetical protein